MWVGGVLNFQSCCMPLSLTSKTCPVTESEMPGARVGFTLSTWRVTPFLCVLFPLPSLFLFFHLCFRLFFFLSLFLSFFLLSSFLSPSPSILPFFPSFQSFLSQVGWGVDLNISLLLRSGMKGCLERGQIAVEAVNSMDLFWGALGVTFT